MWLVAGLLSSSFADIDVAGATWRKWVALYSALMDLTSPSQTGLGFTVFQSADSLLAVALGLAGGWFAQHLGYAFCALD